MRAILASEARSKTHYDRCLDIIIFLGADFFALVIQAIGGGMASAADDPTAGGHVMLAGIVIQMGTLPPTLSGLG